ncbi:MAG TPA: acyl-CoA dehydrogenase C-terminal domain-containing protein [Candidatus Acidoferrales bacterium]|nr:acyl-CoA dehydrogenase C-terminal domain-containing protein [Candidatus Acidoferrales bacterium]
MIVYKAPLKDLRFVLYEILDFEGTVGSLPGYQEAGREVVESIVEEAGRFCEKELLVLNRRGDLEGCVLADGEVRTPRGFKEAYQKFVAAGWPGLACAREDGGQGLPLLLQFILHEFIASTNLSFGIYAGLTAIAYQLVRCHGSEEQKRLILPKLAAGVWSGTMCLTEAHCGSDLGLIRTRAEPGPEGTYRVTGTKVFISGGEQDLTENIVHMVLARLPQAPAGTSGLSLFIVPKLLFDESGKCGARNRISCSSIEQKMGIRASSTCVLNFDGAVGYLVGEPHRGMRIMFTMMNAARLAVGVQGLGLAETAYQSAAAYAKERLQGRSLSGPKHQDKPADPIIVHPDVRKTLLTMRAYTEGARALVLWIAAALERAARHPAAAERRAAEELVSLMTPIIKAFVADIGFEATNRGLQVFGGAGYICATGMEQLVRDARIAQIYEGTNGIQALDLAGRKLFHENGRLLRRFFYPALAFVEENSEASGLESFVLPLRRSLLRLQEATLWLAERGLKDPDEAGAAATEYLRLFGLAALGYLWAQSAKVALAKSAADRDGFYRAKLATARFFFSRLLPETEALLAALQSGAGPITDFREEWF